MDKRLRKVTVKASLVVVPTAILTALDDPCVSVCLSEW